MKAPRFDWENGSAAFINNFERNASESFSNIDRDDLVAILSTDVARAQRMAAAGLRHLSVILGANKNACLLYTSPSPRDATLSRMPSSA